MERKGYFFGILLVFIGILFLLLNLQVLTFEWLLFALSVGILVGYVIKKHIGYLVLGLILLGISLMSILNQYVFIGIDIRSFLFLWILGIICLVVYGRQHSRILLIIGMLLLALGANNLIEELIILDVKWTLYLLFGIAFYIIYLVGFRAEDIEWPKYLGIVMLVVSAVSVMSSYTSIEFGFFKLILYLLPILLILVGIRIIYNAKK